MLPDDNPAAPDLDDLDGDRLDPSAAGTEPIEPPIGAHADALVDLDDDLIDADLGELDFPLDDDDLDELEEQILDTEEDEDEDDFELSLLQELGIDLDAPDSDDLEFDLEIGLDDDSADDEVAA